MSEVTETIKEYLEDELLDDGVELTSDTPLLKTELIDSMGVLTLVGFIEDEFGITVGADDVSTDNFHSLDTITRYVETKLA
jgi:acyl carrier protein